MAGCKTIITSGAAERRMQQGGVSGACLLCVSCPSANELSAILFLLLADQAQTQFDHWNVVDELWGKISLKSDTGYRISP